ncbi:MAG TPA: hypothetical protein VGV12_16550 [Gemmatimonadales bacterium]|nr:hypothetical protein [Gemmatimonadales bacterium]
MSHGMRGLYKFGGAAFVVSGLLFLSRAVLDFMAGAPPSTGVEVLAWIASNSLIHDFQSEILFFAAGCLVPAVVALYQSLANVDRTKAVIGCGIMAVAIPVLMALLIIHGRLVYPVYGIRVSTPDLAAFVVAVFYGGLHATSLLMGIATFVLSLAMMGGVYGNPVVYLGFATAVADIIGSYPYVIGPTPTLVAQGFFAAWFVAVGSQLLRISGNSAAAWTTPRPFTTAPKSAR